MAFLTPPPLPRLGGKVTAQQEEGEAERDDADGPKEHAGREGGGDAGGTDSLIGELVNWLIGELVDWLIEQLGR